LADNGEAQPEFRSDLYYRLNVFPLSLATVAGRAAKIFQRWWNISSRFMFRRMSKQIEKPFLRRPMAALASYEWPGNIRELQNFIEAQAYS